MFSLAEAFPQGLCFPSPETNGARSSLVQVLRHARLALSLTGLALPSFAPGRWARTAWRPRALRGAGKAGDSQAVMAPSQEARAFPLGLWQLHFHLRGNRKEGCLSLSLLRMPLSELETEAQSAIISKGEQLASRWGLAASSSDKPE